MITRHGKAPNPSMTPPCMHCSSTELIPGRADRYDAARTDITHEAGCIMLVVQKRKPTRGQMQACKKTHPQSLHGDECGGFRDEPAPRSGTRRH